MDHTGNIRDKMLDIWVKLDAGRITSQEARTHIGIARTVLETLKVEIAAAHLNVSHIPPVSLSRKAPLKLISGKRKAA